METTQHSFRSDAATVSNTLYSSTYSGTIVVLEYQSKASPATTCQHASLSVDASTRKDWVCNIMQYCNINN
jgi:hypothetical protein